MDSVQIDSSQIDNRPTATNVNTDNSSLGSVDTTICKRYLSDETSDHPPANTSAAGSRSTRQLDVHCDSEKRSEIIHEEVMEEQDMSSELGVDANLDSASKMASVPKLDVSIIYTVCIFA